MKSVVLPVAVVLSTLGGAAFAGGFNTPVADPVIETPAPAVVPVQADANWTGGYLGLALGRHDADLSLGGASVSAKDNSIGIFGGYNHDFGKYVAGGELSFDRASDQGVDINLTRLKGRLGYDAGNWMPYATLGLARVTVDNGTTSGSENGYTYGIGADFAVTNNFVVGAELARSTFDNVASTTGDLDVNSLQLRASYKF